MKPGSLSLRSPRRAGGAPPRDAAAAPVRPPAWRLQVLWQLAALLTFVALAPHLASPLPLGLGWLVLCVAQGVLAHGRRAGPGAAARAEFSQTMLEHAGAAILLSRGERLVEANRPFGELMESDPAACAGRRLAAWRHDSGEWKRHARAARQAFGGGAAYRATLRLRRPDGLPFWAEICGRPVAAAALPLQVVWTVADVSGRIAAAARSQRAEAQLQALIATSADWYWQTDAFHHLTLLEAQQPPTAAPLQDALGRQWWQLRRGGNFLRHEQSDVQHSFERRQSFRRLIVEVSDGPRPTRWLALCGTPRVGEHGNFIGHHGIALDVTDELRGNERIRHLAYHDALTGLPNRRLLADRLSQAIARAERYRERIGVILLDLDDFKRINDLGGHAAGDQALLETADRLRSCLRSCDTVGRLLGDTFVVLLTEIELPGEADQVAVKILHTLNQPLERPAPRTPLGTSIGLAIFPEDARDADSLLEVADRRMFRAKRRGGQRIERA